MSLNNSGMIYLEQRPGDENVGSNIAGVGNPMNYLFRRYDYSVTSIVNNSGNIRFVVTGNQTAFFTAGKTFLLIHQSGDKVAPMYITITSSSFSTNTTVDTSTPYSNYGSLTPANYPCGALDMSLANFYLEVEIWYTGGSGVNALFSALRISPNYASAYYDTFWIYCDVSKVMQSFVSPDNVHDYLSANANDCTIGVAYRDAPTRSFLPFNIKYRAVWTGGSTTQTQDANGTTLGETTVAINGGFQINQGKNTYTSYIMSDDAIKGGKNWLTTFTTPKCWLGYPFTLSFIFRRFNNGIPSIELKTYLVDGTLTGTYTQSVNNPTNNLSLMERYDPQFHYQAATSNTMLQNNISYFTVQLKTTSPSVANSIITVNCINTSLMQNIILLYWRNRLGGDAYFGFDYNQEAQYFYQNNTKNKRYNIFAEGLTIQEWDVIQDMSTLGTIYKPTQLDIQGVNKDQARIGQQVYMFDQNYVRTGVIVIPTEAVTETKRRAHRMQLTIELPQVYQPI